jgi:predicted GNAT superfamily acetyltransferase
MQDVLATSAPGAELGVLLAQTLAASLAHTWAYADACGAEEAYLVIFDRKPDKAWAEKVWRREEVHQGLSITVWGM